LDFLIRLSLYWKSLFKKIGTQKKWLNSLNRVGGKEVEEHRNRNFLHLKKVVFRMVVFDIKFPENKKEV